MTTKKASAVIPTAVKPWVNAYNYQQHKKVYNASGEVNTEKSRTVPDLSMGLKELLTRFGQDRTLRLNQNYYFDEEGSPNFDISKMDKMDVEEMKHQNRKKISQLRVQLGKIKDADERAAAEKQIERTQAEQESLDNLRRELTAKLDKLDEVPEKATEAKK